MKQIKELPKNYDSINSLDMRSMFEAEDEPLIDTLFHACGYVGNKPISNDSDDDTWAIDVYHEDGLEYLCSFLYTSKYEYLEDCKLLGLETQKD